MENLIGTTIQMALLMNIPNSFTAINGSFPKLKYIVQQVMNSMFFHGLTFMEIGLRKTLSLQKK